MEALKLDPIYTFDDILSLPEGERAELIDGQIYYMASPKPLHQEIQMNLSAAIHNHLKSKDGPCKVYPAPFAVFLKKNNSTYVEPDITVICDPKKIDPEKGAIGAPDWIIEIMSTSSASHDCIRKLHLYQSSGVLEYWIVDPANNAVYVYYFSDNKYKPQTFSFTDKIKVNIFDDLEIDFGAFGFG